MVVCIVCSIFSLQMYAYLGGGEYDVTVVGHVLAMSHVAEVSHAIAKDQVR